MSEFLNFRTLNVTGSTKEEALSSAPFELVGDATTAYKTFTKNMEGGVSEADKKRFMMEYLAKKTKNVKGAGFYITNVPASENKKKRPYKVSSMKEEPGTKKYKTCYQVIDDATDRIIFEFEGRKTDMIRKVKELYANGSYVGNARCRRVKLVENDPVICRTSYFPSKAAQTGSYTLFGIMPD